MRATTCFAAAARRPSWRAPAAPGTSSSEREPILIVDDSAAMQNLLAEIVRGLGEVPHLAADAQQARTLLALHRYSCALIDRALPDGDGLELVRQLANDSEGTQLLV